MDFNEMRLRVDGIAATIRSLGEMPDDQVEAAVPVMVADAVQVVGTCMVEIAEGIRIMSDSDLRLPERTG